MDSAVRPHLDSTTTRVAPAQGAESVCPLRWTHASTALSTRTTGGMIGNDGPSVSSTVLVSVMEISAVLTVVAADTDGLEPTVTRGLMLVSALPREVLGNIQIIFMSSL